MLKELEKKLRDNHAAWTEDRLWDAFAAAAPGKVKGRSAGRPLRRPRRPRPLRAGTTARARALRRIRAPSASTNGSWTKPRPASTFTPEQLAWLNLIRDHIATSLSIEPEDFDYAPFNQRGGLGKAHQLFGEQLPKLLDELNEVLAA